MNTKNNPATARAMAIVILLSFTPAAFAQGPTTPLGGQTPSPVCPEYVQAVRDVEDLVTQAKFKRGQANYNDDQARSFEKNVKDVRIARYAAQRSVERQAAYVANLDPRHPNAEFAKEMNYLRQYSAELQELEAEAEQAGARLAQAIQYRELADRQRAEALALEAKAKALLESARAKCSVRSDAPAEVTDGPAGDTKEKKEKKSGKGKSDKDTKSKGHSLGRSLFGVGIAVGTHFALGGGRRERAHRSTECDKRHP